jgi:hypothetical protein
VTGVLNLVDLTLTANLILIVIFSSLREFHPPKIDSADHPDWPEGLTQVDFGELKQKLLGSIVSIAAVDALAWYFDLEKYADTSRLVWVLAFPSPSPSSCCCWRSRIGCPPTGKPRRNRRAARRGPAKTLSQNSCPNTHVPIPRPW